jgi:hypothetical protein
MKINKPLTYFFVGQLLFSFILGYILELLAISITYSSLFYLLLCIANAGHFIEENSKKIWILESEVKNRNTKEKIEPTMDRNFFVLFSHVLVIVSFLYYIPISFNIFWAMIFGLTLSLMEIGNGIVHFIILAKYKLNTGCISGTFQLLFGILVWLSFFL